MNEYQHITVMRAEAVQWLNVQPHGVYVDVTFGGGGHSEAILQAEPTCRVIACDWDTEAIEMNGHRLRELYGDRITFVWTNFAKLGFHLKRLGVGKVQGILADFGTSQHQIFTKEGFSFEANTPLDMRMSPAHQQTTAAHIVNHAPEEELMYIIGQYGEERQAKIIARAIGEARKKKPITTTHDLASVILQVIPRGGARIHPATRTFQALRIVVNKELDNITALLVQAPALLMPGGRLVCISFHSLEDRLVKQGFLENPSVWQILTRAIVTPTEAECSTNPSARSARLRAAERR